MSGFWIVSLSIPHLNCQKGLEKKLCIWKTRTCFSWVVGWGILGESLYKVSERSLFYTFDFWIVSLSIAHLDWQKDLEKTILFKYRFCQIVWFLNHFAQYSSSRLTKLIRKEVLYLKNTYVFFMGCRMRDTGRNAPKSIWKKSFLHVWFLNRFAQYSSSRLTKVIRKEAFSDGPSAKPFDF